MGPHADGALVQATPRVVSPTLVPLPLFAQAGGERGISRDAFEAPSSRAPRPCPATASLTTSASFNNIGNRQ